MRESRVKIASEMDNKLSEILKMRIVTNVILRWRRGIATILFAHQVHDRGYFGVCLCGEAEARMTFR